MTDHPRRALSPTSVVMQPTDNGAVLMDPTTGNCYELNRIGAEIWKLLAAGQPDAEIASTLAARYGVPQSEVAADVARLLADLARHRLVGASSR
jgi:hypothetical protein